ncbi:MAG: type secretion system protein GspL [Verrucomicrobiaceae bacterium]|nr:type secretion system protein GspL [Verrucomicrobiaceae bacterium]
MMKQFLVLQLPVADLDDNSPIGWFVFDDDEILRQQGITPLGQLQPAIAAVFTGGETLVLVPGELVLLTSVRIPSRQLRQIKQALPYMVEELIADNIEDVHLALPDGAPAADTALPVAVVHHHLLINWLDQLYQHGIKPSWMCPDTLAAPWREHGRSFFVSGERVLYRDHLHGAQVFFLPQIETYLTMLKSQLSFEEIGALPRYQVNAGRDDAAGLIKLREALDAQFDVEINETHYTETAGEVLAANALRHRDDLINLLQGGYRVQRQTGAVAWRRTLVAASIGVLIYCGISAASGLWFSWCAKQVEEQTFSFYRELFPQERRVVSPKKQMQAHLRGPASDASSALPLLAKTALGLRNNSVQLDEIRYTQQRNDLQLQLRTPTMEVLDKIKQQLDGVGLSVEINSATQRGNEALGRISVRERQS